MKIPLYIIEEVIIRLQEFNPEIGKLKRFERLGSQMIIKTNEGMITVPVSLLSSQLNNPWIVKQADIKELATQFIKEKASGNLLVPNN